MTDKELGAFVDWLDTSHTAITFEIGMNRDAARPYVATLKGMFELKTATGATPRKAIAALAEKVLPKPQCCGACAHYQTFEEQPSCCTAPVPDVARIPLARWRNPSHGTTCPCFQRRPE